MIERKSSLLTLFILEAFTKGLSLFYFVLLPVFYAQTVITSVQLGFIGALSLVLLIIGALIVTRWLHSWETKKLLEVAAVIGVIAAVMLFIGSTFHLFLFLVLSYMLVGLCVGIARSGTNAVAAYLTTKGDRYTVLAQSGLIIDIIRMIFPIIIAVLVSASLTVLGVILIVIVSILFLIFTFYLPQFIHTQDVLLIPIMSRLRDNKAFQYIITLEFLDSLSSSQLFVFLPLLFLTKGYSLQNSLLLQSFIFLGYLTGRFFVTFLAKRYSGIQAVAYAELGMVVTIVLLLITNQVFLLYILSFALGVFGRGTSPAIKGLSLDSLSPEQIKKGSAAHVVAGDSGSTLGQFFFGILFASLGAMSPFIVSAIIALFIVILCFIKPLSQPVLENAA